jgi:hypothetical protein
VSPPVPVLVPVSLAVDEPVAPLVLDDSEVSALVVASAPVTSLSLSLQSVSGGLP